MGEWRYDTTPGSNDTAATGIDWTNSVTPSGVDNNVRQQMADRANMLLDQSCSIVSSGNANALTLATNSVVPSLQDGRRVSFVAGTAANAGATLNVDGLGARALWVHGAAIAAGDIEAGYHVDATYDASADSANGAWVLHNTAMKAYVSENFIAVDGSSTVTADIDFGGNRQTSVADPIDAQDGATKNYVDTRTIGTDDLDDDAVTAAKLANGAVTSAAAAPNTFMLLTGAQTTTGLKTFAGGLSTGTIDGGVGPLQIDVDESEIIRITQAGLIRVFEPIQLAVYTVAQLNALPSPAAASLVYCSNGDDGQACLAVYGGSTWRRISFGATVSGSAA